MTSAPVAEQAQVAAQHAAAQTAVEADRQTEVHSAQVCTSISAEAGRPLCARFDTLCDPLHTLGVGEAVPLATVYVIMMRHSDAGSDPTCYPCK